MVLDAFAHLGVGAEVTPDDDLKLLTVEPDGVAVALRLVRRTLVDGDAAGRLLKAGPSAGALMVLGDRVTEEARRKLLAAGAGYLDLRGHLALRTDGLVISAEIPSIKATSERTDALAGKVGLEVATRLLITPADRATVRGLARELDRSPSTVSEVLSSLRRDELLDKRNELVDAAGLFWRVADRWTVRRTHLASAPDPEDPVMARILRLGLEDIETTPGWALTDTAAAVAYDAPVAIRSGQQLDFLIPDEAVLHRAVRLLGAADPSAKVAVSVRVPPVPMALARRTEPRSASPWPLAHPLFVALDLAQDAGRGRETLEAWEPDPRWARVW